MKFCKSFQNTWKPASTQEFFEEENSRHFQGADHSENWHSLCKPTSIFPTHPFCNFPIREPLECCLKWQWFFRKYQVLPLQRTTSTAMSYCFFLGSSSCQKSKKEFPSFPILHRQRGRIFFLSSSVNQPQENFLWRELQSIFQKIWDIMPHFMLKTRKKVGIVGEEVAVNLVL